MARLHRLPQSVLKPYYVTLEAGSQVDLGGATAASIPVGSPCQAATGSYFIVGDYSQPQPD